MVDRWIAHRRWLSGSRCSVQNTKSMEVSPQLSGHWMYGGLGRGTVGDQTPAGPGDGEERYIAAAWSEASGSLQQLTGRNSTNGTPGARPRAATGEADQQQGAEPPRPRHCNRDPLGPRTLRHPRKRRSRPSGELSPRQMRKHNDSGHTHRPRIGLDESPRKDLQPRRSGRATSAASTSATDSRARRGPRDLSR